MAEVFRSRLYINGRRVCDDVLGEDMDANEETARAHLQRIAKTRRGAVWCEELVDSDSGRVISRFGTDAALMEQPILVDGDQLPAAAADIARRRLRP